MNRRGFLGSILALGAAPAIVRADSLMRIIPRATAIVGFDVAGPDLSLGAYDIEVPDLALSIDEFSRRYIVPAVARLSALVEADLLYEARMSRLLA